MPVLNVFDFMYDYKVTPPFLDDNFEKLSYVGVNTWVISKVLHTVCFLFKYEFILQNTHTGLQCNLHCALSQRSSVWASLVFLSGRLRC